MASRESVFLAAYDAGGSALVLLGNSPSLTGRPPSPEGLQIRGIIALESPLWSLYREESSQIPGLPPNAGWFPSVRHGLKQWFLQWKPKKITGLKPVPELSLPLLLLVSPRAWESKHRARYEAVFAAFDAARAAAVLAAAPGAGPLDYSDIPVRYPLVSAFFWRGSSGPGGGAREAPGKTADIITHFAVQILEAGAAGASSLLQTTPLPPGSRWEQRN
jgi:hypothetical protein